jgi:hypothetical protein
VADDGLADHDAAGRTARASVFGWRATCYPRPRVWLGDSVLVAFIDRGGGLL